MAEFIKLFDDIDHIYIVCVEGEATDGNFIHAVSLLPPYDPLDVRAISFNGDWTNIPSAAKFRELFEIYNFNLINSGYGSKSMSAVDRATEFKHNILKLANSAPSYRK